jgi:hypothetical protein
MLFEAARFQDDPQQKSLTAPRDFRPNTATDPHLRAVPQIDKALTCSKGILPLSLHPAVLETIPAFRRHLDAHAWRHVRHAALFRKRRTNCDNQKSDNRG